MSYQLWSWLLTIVGVTGFILAGRKVWWCWYINIACQGLWVTYAIVTEQYGFIVASAVYTVVFWRNAVVWTREHKAAKKVTVFNDNRFVDVSNVDVDSISFSAETAAYISRFNNIDERGKPRCGVWSPELGPCIRDWPHEHENEESDVREQKT